MEKKIIHIEADINAPIQTVWREYNNPEAIQQWNQASSDWHCPFAENDLRTGGRFKSTMAAKDGSFSFDFGGEYTQVSLQNFISYRMDDGRTAEIQFHNNGNSTTVAIDFVAEDTNPIEMQQEGWQAILNSFKAYVEG